MLEAAILMLMILVEADESESCKKESRSLSRKPRPTCLAS